MGRGVNLGDVSATVAGISDPEAGAAWNKQRRELPGKGSTLGAIVPNEGGENGILARTGKYAPKKRGGQRMALETSATVQRLKPSADQAAKRAKQREAEARND